MGDKVLTVGIVYLTCHFVINVILSFLAGSGTIFQHSFGEVSNRHVIHVTPARYVFEIWKLIYVWLLAAYAYLLIGLCRSTSGNGSPVFGRIVTLLLIVNSIFYTVWLFVWDNMSMTGSAVCMIGIAITAWIALVIFSVSLWNNVLKLKEDAPTDLFLYRLIQNGFGIYATWATLAGVVTLGVALAFDGSSTDPGASLIALGLFAAFLIAWTLLDLLCLDHYFRYMVTPLFVVLWMLVGIMIKQGEFLETTDNGVITFTAVLIFATIGLIILKNVMTVYRYKKRPLYSGLSLPVTRSENEEL